MKKLLTRLSRYYHIFYIAVVLIASVFLLYLIIPGQSRFQYEFQKNAPWRHETLIAPFDFAINKPSEVVEVEKDSIEQQFLPYFDEDTLIGIQQTQNFKIKLESVREDVPVLTPGIIMTLMTTLEDIYETGIISQSPETYPVLAEKDELFIITNKIAEKAPVSTIHSLKTAFQEISDSTQNLIGDQFAILSQHVNFTDFIQENLIYNEEFSTQELDNLISSISTTEGMIQAGERIISQGDIVTSDNYLILESLKESYESKLGEDIDSYLIILGKLILIIACLLIMILYLVIFRPEIFKNKLHFSFILMMIVLMTFVSSLISSMDNLNIYLVPLAILPIFIRIFFDSRSAIFTLLVASLLIGYFAPNNYEFIFLNLIAGIIAVFSLNKLHRRSHLIYTAIWVFLSYSVVFIALSLVQEGNIQSIEWPDLIWFGLNSILILISYLLIYIFEKTLQFCFRCYIN